MLKYETIDQLIRLAEQKNTKISEIVIQAEMDKAQRSREDIWDGMSKSLDVMRDSVKKGLELEGKSASGLVGGDARKLNQKRLEGKTLCGDLVSKAVAYGIAVNEINACMGRIVACPTAGSCGILPGALLAIAEELNCSDEDLISALFTSAGIGIVIATNASIAGAEGGCQAECGSAGAMAAGAMVELVGGTPEQVADAIALALKNALGLVCDPVAGLVEVPCVKRNGFYALQALVAADLALAGVKSVIPVDEVIHAMLEIGRSIPPELRETAGGGLAKTPTGEAITARLFGKK